PEIAEGQAAERGPPGHEEVLMDGIGEEAIGRAGDVRARAARLAAAVAGGEGVGPGAVTREPAEDAGAVERLERQEPGGGLDERRVRQEQERGEGHGLRMDDVRLAPVEADRTPALGEVEGQESWRRVPAEEERRVLLRVGDVTALREERLVEREVNELEKLAALLGDALGSLQGGEAEARQLRVGPRGEADAVGRRHLGAPPPPLLAVGGLEGDP